MDLSLLFAPLSQDPQFANDQWITLRGAATPVVVAREWIPPETAAEWLVANRHISLVEQVRSALAAGDQRTAWKLIPGGALADPDLRLALEMWSVRHRAELDLGDPRDGVIVLGHQGPQARRLAGLAGNVADDLDQQFALAWWPPWAGPLVVITDDRALDGLASADAILARPALPILRLTAEDPGNWREHLARALTRITLGTLDPDGHLPTWFADAMVGVAAARARGEGPSPRAMHERRRQAGSDALRRLLLDVDSDPALATAIGAMLCHRHRARHLSSLIELLRNQVDGLTALEIAYDLEVDDLIRQR